MRYIRKINGYVEESPIPPYRGAEYYAAHGYLRCDSTLPLSRLDIVDGKIIELPEPEPTEEWVSKEAFINALYALLPEDQLAAALNNPEWPESAPAKLTGSDTKEVLKEAGYSEEELQAMLEAGDISEAVITVK